MTDAQRPARRRRRSRPTSGDSSQEERQEAATREGRLVDGLAKQLIDLDRAYWIRWATDRADLRFDAALDTEFRLVFRQSDSLMRVADSAGRFYLLLFELQYRYDETMPRRMNAYASQAEQKDGLPVFPVLINFQPPPAGQPLLTTYESECFGLRVRREFHTINLWEVPAGEALQAGSPALLALLPFLQGGEALPLIERALAVLRAHWHGQDLEAFMLYLIHQVGGDEALRQLGARLDVAMVRQTAWFQEIIDEGRREGRQEGADAGKRDVIRRLLEERFAAPVPADIAAALDACEGERLDALALAVLRVASLDDFRARLAAT